MRRITKLKFIFNNNKKKSISLKKKNHNISQRIEDVLKLNIDGYSKKYINFSKSTEMSKTINQGKEDETNLLKNPLILSSSIRQVQRFLPNINILLNTESNFNNYNPSRQEHIKFEDQIKKEISFYTNEEKNLREKLITVEEKLLNLENEINDNKIKIEALKTISVSNARSPLKRVIIKQLEDEFNKEEEKLLNKNSNNSLKYSSPKKKIKIKHDNLPTITYSDFNTNLNIKLMESEKLNKEREKNVKETIEIIQQDKGKVYKELNDINEELRIVHNNRKVLIDQLYNHYLSLLKDGKDSRKEGLAWIIMEIFYLNKKILFSNFPKYLDNDCIHYLFKIANLNIRIIKLESKVKNKKDNLHKYILNLKGNISNNNIKTYLFDNTEENINNYEYNKKQLSTLISAFSKKYNFNKNNNLIKEKSYKETINTTINDSDTRKSLKKKYIFKTSKNLSNLKSNMDTDSLINEYIYKNPKKKQYKINELQKFFDENNKSRNNSSYKDTNTLNSNEFQIYSNLSNELFQLKQEKEKLKLKEMERIFKEYQKNNYRKRYQVEKKVVISSLIGEDNLENELFRQARREKEYMQKINKIQLFQNKYKNHKSSD